jgi:excisionase family DNA binding protein
LFRLHSTPADVLENRTPPQLLTMNIDETSKILGLPKMTIKRWIRQNKIPVREMSADFLFDKKEIEKWAQKHNF